MRRSQPRVAARRDVWTRSRTWDARLFGPPLYRLSYPDESSRRDSNPRPRGPEPRALPTAPLLGDGVTGGNRTRVPRFTASCSPLELRSQSQRWDSNPRVQSPEPRWHNRYACSRRRRTRGRRRDTNGSRVLVRPAGTGTRPPTARSYCCTHTPTVINERPPLPPSPPKTLRPAWRIAQAGRLDHPLGRGGRLRSHPLSVPAQPDVAIEPIECRLGRDEWADAHTRGPPGAMRQAIARSG